MLSTYLNEDAARRLRHGIPFVYRDEIARLEGVPVFGEPVMLRDEKGEALGVGDVDLESSWAIRRLGLPEEAPEGIIQRHLRQAVERRAMLVQDPRYCRVVNDDGDALPGLIVDRYEAHFVVQTLTRAMDARVEEISRSLVEVMGARSILLRNDSPRRAQMKLPLRRPHALYGTPPRWSRVLELGARFTADLFSGRGTGYSYDLRGVRRVVRRISQGARVLDVRCDVGGLFVHAGLGGAKRILAFDPSDDTVEMARENADANGLQGKVWVERADPMALLEDMHERFDLVLLDALDSMDPKLPAEEGFVQLVQLCMRNTRHGGRLLVAGYHPPLPVGQFDDLVARAAELEGRAAIRTARPGLPSDYPTVLGAPGADYLSAVAIEVS